MKNHVKIFCEGITDQFFLADFIEITFGLKFDKTRNSRNKQRFDVNAGSEIEIIDVGGCSKLSSALYSQMLQDNSRGGGVNLVIFDADYKDLINGNKGFSNCKQKLQNLQKNKSIHFDYYIWPNNEKDGEVEDLIMEIIAPSNKEVYQCINSHCECLESIENKQLHIPDLKAKINFLVHTLQSTSKLDKRNYTDTEIWQIDLDKSETLSKLHAFLKNYLSN